MVTLGHHMVAMWVDHFCGHAKARRKGEMCGGSVNGRR
jgi:hypothetical protein